VNERTVEIMSRGIKVSVGSYSSIPIVAYSADVILDKTALHARFTMCGKQLESYLAQENNKLIEITVFAAHDDEMIFFSTLALALR